MTWTCSSRRDQNNWLFQHLDKTALYCFTNEELIQRYERVDGSKETVSAYMQSET